MLKKPHFTLSYPFKSTLKLFALAPYKPVKRLHTCLSKPIDGRWNRIEIRALLVEEMGKMNRVVSCWVFLLLRRPTSFEDGKLHSFKYEQ